VCTINFSFNCVHTCRLACQQTWPFWQLAAKAVWMCLSLIREVACVTLRAQLNSARYLDSYQGKACFVHLALVSFLLSTVDILLTRWLKAKIGLLWPLFSCTIHFFKDDRFCSLLFLPRTFHGHPFLLFVDWTTPVLSTCTQFLSRTCSDKLLA